MSDAPHTQPPHRDQSAKAVILLSGGLDSATALAIATAAGRRCFALSIDYRQRHRCELAAAQRIASSLQVEQHRILTVDLGALGGSALTDDRIDIPDKQVAGIPATYVPARNLALLSLGVAWAEILNADELYFGANQLDYSGYPDCREEFIDAFARAAQLGTKRGVIGHGLRICAPLLNLTKAQIIHRGIALGIDYGLTVSCYRASPESAACGTCDSCRIRQRGFDEAGVKDPLRQTTT